MLVPNLLIGNASVCESPIRNAWIAGKPSNSAAGSLQGKDTLLRWRRCANQRFEDKCVPNQEIGNERVKVSVEF